MKNNYVLSILASLALSVQGIAQSQGPNPCSFVQNFPCSCPNAMGGLWLSEFQATTSDDLYAQVRVMPYPYCVTSNCWWSRHLYAANYGFNIPGNATILGIEVFVERRSTVANSVMDSAIQMMYNTVPAGVNKAGNTTWGTTDAVVSYGAPNDTWGLTFTPTEVNTPAFGMYVKVQNTSTTDTAWAYVDQVQMTVYYQTLTGIYSQTSTAQLFNAWYDASYGLFRIAFTGDPASVNGISLFDMNGKQVLGKEGYDASLSAGDLSPGIYFVKMTADGKEYSRKVIVPGTTR